jgi:hypothetical protein
MDCRLTRGHFLRLVGGFLHTLTPMNARRTQPTLTAGPPSRPVGVARGGLSWHNLHTLTPMHAANPHRTLPRSTCGCCSGRAFHCRTTRALRCGSHSSRTSCWPCDVALWPEQCEPPVPSASHHPAPGARIPVHFGRPSGAACRPSLLWTGVRHRRPRRPAHVGPAAVLD